MTSIILVNYKGWADSIECLESIFKSTQPDLKIILVDNASSDGSIEKIIAWARGQLEIEAKNPQLAYLTKPPTNKPIPFTLHNSSDISEGSDYSRDEKLVLIQSNKNEGFAAGNNLGINYALIREEADYIWLLNNDTVINPDTLNQLVASAKNYKKQNKRIGIIGAKLMHYYKPSLIQAVGGILNAYTANTTHLGDLELDKGQYDFDISDEINYPVGASMFVSVDFIKDVGLMNESYFLYYEELDWVYRGSSKNWSIGYCWQAKIYHKEGASIGSNSSGKKKSALADFYGIRNKLLFTRKYFPENLFWVSISFSVVIVRRLLRKQYKRIPTITKMLFSNEEQLGRFKFGGKWD